MDAPSSSMHVVKKGINIMNVIRPFTVRALRTYQYDAPPPPSGPTWGIRRGLDAL